MNRKIKAHLFLFTTAFIWGSAFVAQKEAMTYLGPFAFTAIRMFVGGATLVLVILVLSRAGAKPNGGAQRIAVDGGSPLFVGGFFCGAVLFFACTVQQVGLQYTTAGKAGFITALYIIIVPVLGLFMKKRLNKIVWLCVLLALVGIYLLCMDRDFSINKGDLIILLSALGYALHIITIDYFSPKCDAIKMSCIQLFVCGALCVPMVLVEAPAAVDVLRSWFPIFYTGVISCGIAYTLQVAAQRDATPTITALILSFESVFAVLTGFALLHEVLSVREIAGCVLMFVAIITAQLPQKPGAGKPAG